MNEHAAIYTRVSSKGQEEGSSLQTQEEACREYCANHQYIVSEDHVYREVYTGVELWDRPQLTQLREAIRQSEITVVVAYSIDRMSRDPVHLGIVLSEADRVGCRVTFVSEPLDDTPEGQLIRFIRGYAAKVEHEKIRERNMRGKRARAVSGKLLHGPRPLYGYRWNAERTGYEVDPVTAPVVQRIYQMVYDGATLRTISKTLSDDGILTPTGNQRWAITSINKLLRHPFYAGRPSAYRVHVAKVKLADLSKAEATETIKRMRKDERGNPLKSTVLRNQQRAADEHIPLPSDSVPALVSDTLWEYANEQLARNRQQSARNAKDPAKVLLRGGFAVCGYCGRQMTIHWKYGKPLYRCEGKTRFAVECQGPSMYCHLLDGPVWDTLTAIRERPELIAQRLSEVLGSDPTATDLGPVERQFTDLDKKRARLGSLIATIDDDDMVEPLLLQLKALAEQRRRLEASRDEMLARRETWTAVASNLNALKAWYENDRSWDRFPEVVEHDADDPAFLAAMDSAFYTVFPADGEYDGRRALLNQMGVKVRIFRSDDTEHERWGLETALDLPRSVYTTT